MENSISPYLKESSRNSKQLSLKRKRWYFVPLLVYSLKQHILIGYLFIVRHCDKNWEYEDKKVLVYFKVSHSLVVNTIHAFNRGTHQRCLRKGEPCSVSGRVKSFIKSKITLKKAKEENTHLLSEEFRLKEVYILRLKIMKL